MASTYELIIQATDKTSGPLRNVTASVTKVESSALKATKALAGMAGSTVRTSLNALSGGLKSAAAAATVAATGFVYLTKKNLDALDSIEKVSSKLGIGARFLTTWGKVAEDAGLSTEQFNTGLQRFTRRLGEAQAGQGQLLNSMNEMGVALYNNDGTVRSTTDVFQDYIKALGDTENKNRQLVHAMNAFDTEGVQFVNVAQMGSEAIAQIAKHANDAGIAIDDNLVKQAAAANDALSRLFDYATGFQLQFFGSLAEPIEQAAEVIRNGLQVKIDAAGGMKSFANDLAGTFLKMVAEFVIAGARTADDIRAAFIDGTNILKEIVVAMAKALSYIPGVEIDIQIGNKEEIRKQLGDQLKEYANQYLELRKAAAEAGAMGIAQPFSSGSSAGITGLEAALIDLEQKMFDVNTQIEKLESGSTTWLTKLEHGSNSALDAVSPLVTGLYEQAWQLGENAEQARKAAEFTNRFAAEEALMSQRVVAGNVALNNKGKAIQDVNSDLGESFLFSNRFAAEEALMSQAVTASEAAINQKHYSLTQHNNVLEDSILFTQRFAAEEKLMAQAVESTSNAFTTYDQYLDSAIKTAIEKTKQDSYAHKVYSELLALYDQGVISLAALTQAEERLGLAKKETNKQSDIELTYLQKTIQARAEELGNIKDVERALKNEKGEIGALAKEYGISEAEVRKALESRLPTIEKVKAKMVEVNDYGAEMAKDFIKNFKSAGDALGSNIARGLAEGKLSLNSFKDYFNNFLQQILEAIIQANITGPLMGSLIGSGPSAGTGGLLGGIASSIAGSIYQSSGSFVGPPAPGGGGIIDSILGFFTGARATGGPVAMGQSYLVGERGPELFTPSTAGNITSNEALNSGGQPVVVNFNINAIDTQTGVEFIVEQRETISAVVSDALNKQGRRGIVA